MWNCESCIHTNNILFQWINTQLSAFPLFNGFWIIGEIKYLSCWLTKHGIIYNCLCSLSASLLKCTNSFYRKMNPCQIAENTACILGVLMCFFFLTFKCYQTWVIKSLKLSWEIIKDSWLLQRLGKDFTSVFCLSLYGFVFNDGWLVTIFL